MSLSQILQHTHFNEPSPCAGFDESLVLAVKDCFLESDIRDILIQRSSAGGGVVFFSRLCTSLASEKKVCHHCDSWFTQISSPGKQKAIFGIDNFLDNHVELDKENSSQVTKQGPGRPRKEKKYTCLHCDKSFKSKTVYLKHEEKYHGEKDDVGSKKVCEHCGALISSSNMRQHVKRVHTHRHEKNLRCEHCAKEFKYRSELAVHLTHHTGELNFSCSTCGKSFRRAAEARLCEKGHKGMFNFNCRICDYKTHKKHHLERHLKSHSKSTPYRCPLCGFKSGRKDNLKQHVEKKHCSSSNSIKHLEELYPDMYKLHETNQINSEPEKKEPDGKDCLVDVGREGGVVAFGEILESQTQQRYIADHQFEEGNKTSEVTRYLISEDYCERYQDSRYSDNVNQDHHRLMLDQRERLLPVEMFHKMKNINQ